MVASPELLWECVKSNSSFIRKSPNMPVFTAEPANLCGLNSFKFSGLANGKAFDIKTVKTGKKETIIVTQSPKKSSRTMRPKSLFRETGLNKASKKGVASLDKMMGARYYRRDLMDLAKAKYGKVKTSLRKKKITVKSRHAAK
eukprot:gnl/TRDRNA2_/TRDRNA2_178112_c0_seq1.p1 gnl/TRDRNA2_/TRDRNA2_178112_c0~~gnl/TRDRNA2_/TRDRNA2_178112_c0_seq1.p1  ORF type:complete len:167 (+),score=40.54 gnl/TRDRNA2_/TRDRNA2_178112_c0_seq1:73-501(+)